MRRLTVPLLAGLVAAALVALLAFGLVRQGGGGDVVGRSAPAVALPLLGRPDVRRSVGAWRGHVVVVNVFASWCGPCKDEAPLLESAQRRLRARGATVVGVTYNDAEGDARDFVRRHRLTFPVLRDVDETFSHSLGVIGVPETFVLDRRGRIVAAHRAPIDRAFLRRAVAEAL
jgi:cytochrome c biogenesis protein CcmG, thiol:disulfide interchange protein DsbE